MHEYDGIVQCSTLGTLTTFPLHLDIFFLFTLHMITLLNLQHST